MAARSAILSLPPETKAELDRRLVAGGFQGYDALAQWLADAGFEISKSAVHRYGQGFERQVAALRQVTEQAKVAVEAVGDDEDALGLALNNIAKQKLFEALVDFQIDPETANLKELTLAISRVTNAGLRVQQFRQTVRQRAETAAEEVAEIAKAGGLSDERGREIRAKILGITPKA